MFFALVLAPFSFAVPPSSFSGSIQEIADMNKDMESEYGLDEGDGEMPDSPIHPDNEFLSQVTEPGSTPAIVSTARMASATLPDSKPVSCTSSTSTICNACTSSC